MVNEPQNAGAITFQSHNPFANIDFVKKIWLTMLPKCQHSYFVSWGWISTWINSLPPNSDIQLIVGYLESEPVVAFFIGRKSSVRHGFLFSRAIALNSTADAHFDQLFIEYNSILIDPSVALYTDSIIKYMGSLGWDELMLPGVSSKFVSEINLLNSGGKDFYLIVDKATSSFFVDLQKIRDNGMDFLPLLSANKRSQIRRSIKQYEIDGAIQIRQAESLDEALLMFDNLVTLHQQEWEKRGKPGAFANEYLHKFHKELIRERFNSNEIQLLHIFNQRMTIGYLYNFVYEHEVLFYQCGFTYFTENIYRPGLVSHYFAIIHNASKNLSTYDFLAGDSPYKSSLSTDSAPMYWVRLTKSKNRLHLEKSIINIKSKLRSMPKLENRLKRIKYWLASLRK